MMNDYVWNLTTKAEEDKIEHYGTPGMKWGERRYQNEDGSLTPLGRERLYGKSSVETFENRKNRSTEAYMQNARANQYDQYAKLQKAKGNAEAAKRFSNAAKSARANAKLASKGLSKAERDFGKHNYNYERKEVRGMAIGTATAGILGGVAGLGIGSAIGAHNKEYKKYRAAALASYEKYRYTKIKSIS